MDLYLRIHTAFGDYVICFGMIKELSKKYNKIFLFVVSDKGEMHVNNIKRLYKSINNVEIITDDWKKYEDKTLSIGFKKYFDEVKLNPNLVFVKYFYDQVGLSINLMWDNFYFERDLNKEKDIFYNKLHLSDDTPFVFIHEGSKRNQKINRNFIVNKNAQIIILSNYPEISILDITYTIKKAEEIHSINSGPVFFIDNMIQQRNNLFYHRYTRPLLFEQPIFKLKWTIFE